MAYPTITALPTPPSRQRPSDFADEADAFLGALPDFRTETNTAGEYVETKAGEAATSATNAATSETNAATSETNAAASASAASTSETNAAASEAAAAASFDSFDDRYLGSKASDPATDNDGDALLTGAIYYNTTVPELRIYDGAAWQQAVFNVDATGALLTTNNLSDLTNSDVALTNLGLTATATELNYVDGVTSPIQTQLDNISVTNATLTKSFVSGETSTIALSQAITAGAPVVSVTKEVPQTGVTENAWDVGTTGSNYTRHDTAYDTTLTPETVGFSDVDGASYDSVSFSVGSQDTNPRGVAFNSDGTKMYMVGTGDSVYQYSLSTAFDLSTASYDSVSFSVSSQDTVPSGITFNSDGTKMYMVGLTNDNVYQYSLSTGFDLSTASYDSVSFSVSSQDTSPYDIAFNSDGTKMYMAGIANDSVFQYSLSTAFDLSTASYESVSFSVTSQDTEPYGIAFNSDGTKMYMVGSQNDSVHQYSLSTAFDLSTASYDSVSFSVSSQDTGPFGIAFNSDGTKMYIVGDANDSVFQYTIPSTEALVLGTGSFTSTDVGKTIEGNGGEAILTATDGSYSLVTAFNDSSTIASGDWSMYATVFDATNGLELSGLVESFSISTASYDSVSFSVTSQDTTPLGIAFNSDGTKMYMAGTGNDSVYQYSLSTGFDLSTASYDSVSFSVSSQDNNPRDIAFNSDGTKMYILGGINDSVYQYSLSTAFDLSTASYDSVSFSVGSQDATPYGIAFNNDGTKMYMVGTGNESVYQYSLSTGFDLSTASYDSVSFGVSSQDTDTRDIDFNSDGTKMYIVGTANDSVYQYSLSTAFDLSTASYDSVSFSVGSQDANPTGIAFNSDGTKMYMVGASNDSVYQYSTVKTHQPTAQYTPAITNTGGQIDSTYWTDINSMTATEVLGDGQVYYAVSTDGRTTWSVIDDTDGVRPIVRDNAGTWEVNDNSTYSGVTWVAAAVNTELDALQEALATAGEFDDGFQGADTWSYDSVSFSVSSQDLTPTGIAFNSDGTKMYIVGNNNNSVFQYSLSTAFDLSTASYDSVSFSVGSQDITPVGIAFNTDGTKMYIVGSDDDDVHQYSLSGGFDLSTASYDSVSFSVSSQDGNPYGIAFNNDGTKMYMVGNINESVYQYSLSTAFDLSTASYDSVSFSVSSQDTSPADVAFNTDGTKMYVVGHTGDTVYQYTLSTAFDLSSASYDSVSFSVAGQETNPYGLVFNNDGTKMYIVGLNTDAVYQYTTSGTSSQNRMDKTQLEAVTDANHYTLSDELDLMIALYLGSESVRIPSSDGVSINYDANVKNEGAVLGTDYDYDFPANDVVRITSNATQNLKVRVV